MLQWEHYSCPVLMYYETQWRQATREALLYPVGIVYEVRDHSLQTRLVFISKCEDEELRMMDADSGFRYSTTVQVQYYCPATV